mgnify:CR=1 FL=1
MLFFCEMHKQSNENGSLKYVYNREIYRKKDKELALKAEITALKNQLALEQATVQKLREDYPVFHATRVERNQEQVIRDTRQGNTSFWRQPLLKRMNDDSPWWKELEPAIVERFAKGTRRREV